MRTTPRANEGLDVTGRSSWSTAAGMFIPLLEYRSTDFPQACADRWWANVARPRGRAVPSETPVRELTLPWSHLGAGSDCSIGYIDDFAQ
jgi:hypothetical protein